MEPAEFDVLSEAAADIAATKLAWSRYGDFLKERDELANRDWLSMRDQVRSLLHLEDTVLDGRRNRHCCVAEHSLCIQKVVVTGRQLPHAEPPLAAHWHLPGSSSTLLPGWHATQLHPFTSSPATLHWALLTPLVEQVWKVEDFLVKWSKDTGAIKGAADSVALILLNEIEVYRRCLPYLKLLRGAGWEDSHWAQLFSLLGLKASGAGAVSRETVTLADFLDKAETLAANADKIKALDAQVALAQLLPCCCARQRCCCSLTTCAPTPGPGGGCGEEGHQRAQDVEPARGVCADRHQRGGRGQGAQGGAHQGVEGCPDRDRGLPELGGQLEAVAPPPHLQGLLPGAAGPDKVPLSRTTGVTTQCRATVATRCMHAVALAAAMTG
jgi:hypothetical protein